MRQLSTEHELMRVSTEHVLKRLVSAEHVLTQLSSAELVMIGVINWTCSFFNLSQQGKGPP